MHIEDLEVLLGLRNLKFVFNPFSRAQDADPEGRERALGAILEKAQLLFAFMDTEGNEGEGEAAGLSGDQQEEVSSTLREMGEALRHSASSTVASGYVDSAAGFVLSAARWCPWALGVVNEGVGLIGGCVYLSVCVFVYVSICLVVCVRACARVCVQLP